MMLVVKLDLSDLYHRTNRKYGKKLNFESVLKRLTEYGETLTDASVSLQVSAYGIQRFQEASGFISCLQRLDIETFFKRPEIINCGDREIKRANWDLGIGIAAVEAMEQSMTEFILGSGSNSMVPLIHYLRGHEIPCTVFGCGIGRELRSVASNIIKITEDLLEQ
jgi:hypothetical protein